MFATIYIPGFYLQAALRYEPGLRERAVAIVDDGGKPAQIAQITRKAWRAGVREGMTSTQGLARCLGLEVRYRSRELERMAGVALLQCAACASPCIEATGDGVCTLDWKGAGEFRRRAQKLVEQLRGQGLIAKVGIAATPGLALLAARNARNGRPIFHVERLEDLHGLPVSALGGSGEFCRMLRRLGIRRVGQFYALPAEGIAARFGEEGLEHWECIAGKSTRLLKLVTAPESFEEGVEFENEIELLEPLLFMIRRFLVCIAGRLEGAYLVAAALELRLGFTAGEDYTRVFSIPSPTRDVETLFRMLFTHLEGFQSSHPIKALHLAAQPCKAVKEQLGLFETSLRDPNQFHQTLARLSALVGADRVGVPVKENTHRPDAFRMQAPAFGVGGKARKLGKARGLALRRFRPPRRAHVLTVNERPASLVIGDFSAPLGEVSGPWAASGDWWDDTAWERTEWEVEAADGRLYRVFWEGEGWFVEGVYD
jgi:protein ImuB